MFFLLIPGDYLGVCHQGIQQMVVGLLTHESRTRDEPPAERRPPAPPAWRNLLCSSRLERDAQKSPAVATGRYMLGANCFPLLSIFFRPNFLAKSPTPIGANNSAGVWSFHSYESPAPVARLWHE